MKLSTDMLKSNFIIRISIVIIGVWAMAGIPMYADDDYEAFKKKVEAGYDRFVTKKETDYAAFRDKINNEYADFLANPWQPRDMRKPLAPPQEPDPTPESTDPSDETPRHNTIIDFDAALNPPKREPRAEPIVPVKPDNDGPRIDGNRGNDMLRVNYFGADLQFHKPDMTAMRIAGNSNRDISEAWRKLSNLDLDPLLADCIRQRDQLALPDWGFMKMLEKVANTLSPSDENLQTVLLTYLMTHCGYKVRLCYDSARRLHMLFATTGQIYNTPYFTEGGYRYVPLKSLNSSIHMCDFKVPGERPLSMQIEESPQFPFTPGTHRELKVKYYPELTVKLTTNKNLIDFYSSYPAASLSTDPMTQWSICANTPASNEVKEQVYPTLRAAVAGKSQYDALQVLLKVAQSFAYDFDDNVWGCERTFWMDESWHYPYSDCEDHAINFARMVRDVLGLEVCLVHYPMHLSASVAITDGSSRGDYFEYKGKKFTLCDATFFYGNVGETPQSCRNANATLIPML